MSKIINFPSNQKTEVPVGTLYDMNRQIMKDMKPLTHVQLAAVQPKLEEWFNMIIDTYAMLLNHDRYDYTIFHLYETQNPNPPAVAAKELLICLSNRGEILSIDETADKAWEIWLKIDDTPYCYYLFRYDDAVIEC